MFLKNILVFVKSLFAAQTIEPEIIGFSGITLETVGNFFTLAGTIICEIIYFLVKWLLAIVDFLQYFIQKLIGLDYWLKPGSKTIQGATDNDLLFQFLYNDTVQNVFRAMVGVFIILTIVFVIFSIVKTEWKYATGDGKGGNSKMQIFRSSFKSLILVLVFPLVLTLGIISSNAILASLVGALNLNMAQTFGGTLFSIAAESANKYRIFASNDDKAPVSQQVTFYVENSTGKTILYSNGSQYPGDKYCEYIADYGQYLATIYGKTGSGADRCTKYTVDTVFDVLVPRKEKNFSGYCVGLQVDGNTEFFLVKCDYSQKEGMYYYLRNILNGKVVSKNQTVNANQGLTGNTVSNLRSDLKEFMENTGKQSFISGANLHSFGSGEVIDAAYNTWGYASVYTQKHTFEEAQSFNVVYSDVLDKFELGSISNAKVSFNSNAVSPYFDNGQFGYVSKQAEYKVMADVIDFICDNNADLYMIDVTSSMVKWDYGEYIPESRFVGGGTDHKVNLSAGATTGASVNAALADDVLPFVVSYSDLCNDADMGNQLYLAHYNKSSEINGSVYVMCWKIIEDGKTKYVPLINGKGYYNETTGVEFPTFKSEFYSNGYRGLVVAKGLLNNETTNQSYGEPTYIASGVKNLSGVEGLESPYYYKLSVNSELYQYAKGIDATKSTSVSGNGRYEISDIIASGISASVSSDDFGSSKYYELINTSDSSAIATDPTIVANMTIYLRDREHSTVKTAKYAGLTMNYEDASDAAALNNNSKYLFVTSDGGYFVVSATKATDFSTGYFIHEVSSYSSGIANVGNREDFAFNIMYLKTDLMSYYWKDDAHKGEKSIANDIALNMFESTTAKYDGKAVFKTIDMHYVNLKDELNFTKSMYMNVSFDTPNNSSFFSYSSSDGRAFRVAQPVSIAGTGKPSTDTQKQMQCTLFFDVNYYDFLTGWVNGQLRRYDITKESDALSDAADTISPVLTETYAVNSTGFAWDPAAVSFDLYDGDRYVATVYKDPNTTCTELKDLITQSTYMMIEYKSFYNIITQNNYSTESAFEQYGTTLRNSFVVGFNRDSLKSRSFVFDFRISLLGKGRLKLIMSTYEVEKDVQKGFLYTSDSLAFDYFFDGEGTVNGNKIELRTFYVPTKVSNPFGVGFWIMVISAALIIKILGTALWGIIKRFYEITLYYIAMPAVASTIVLDDGSRFNKSIQTPLIAKVLSTYGVILGINAFFVLLAPVKSMSNVFTAADIATSGSYFLKALSNLPLFGSYELTAKLLNAYTYILFLLVAFTMISELPGLITRIMQTGPDGDVHASGEKTKGNVTKTLQQAGKTMSGQGLLEGAQEIGQTAMGMIPGSALAQAGAQKLGGLFKGGKGGGGGGSKRDGEDGGGDDTGDGPQDTGESTVTGNPQGQPQGLGGGQGDGDNGDGNPLTEAANAIGGDDADSARLGDDPMSGLLGEGDGEGLIDAVAGGAVESVVSEVGGEALGEITGEIGGDLMNQGIDLIAGDGTSDMINGATSMLGALEGGGGVDQILEHTMDFGVTDLSDGIGNITDLSEGIGNVADMAENAENLTEGVGNITELASTIEDGASSAGLSLVTGIAGNAVGGMAENMAEKMGADGHVADIIGDTVDGFTTDAINGAILTSEGGPTAIAGAVAGGLEGAARKGAESLVENGVEVAVEKTAEGVQAVAEGVGEVVDGVQTAVEGAGNAINDGVQAVADGVSETVENVADQATGKDGAADGKPGAADGKPGEPKPGEQTGDQAGDGKKKGIVDEAKEISEKQKAAVKGFFGMIGGGIMTGLTATGKGLKAAGGFIAKPFVAAGKGIAKAAQAVYGKVLKPVGEGAKNLASKAAKGVSFVANKVKDGVVTGAKAVAGGAKWVGGKVKDGALAVASGAKWVGNKVASGAKWVGRTAKAGFTKAKEGVVTAAQAVYGKVLAPIGRGAKNIVKKAGEGISYVAGKVKDGAHWVGGKVVGGAQWVGRTAKAGFNAAKKGVTTAAQAVYGKVLAPIGRGAKNIVKKAGDGISYVAGKVKDGAHWVGGKVVGGAKWVGNKVAGGAQWVGRTAKAGFNAAKKGVTTAAQAVYGKVLKPIGDGAKKVADKAKAGASYIAGKVKDGAHWVGGKARTVAKYGLATAMTVAAPFKAAGKAVYQKVLKPAGQGIAKAAKATYGAVLKPIGQGAKNLAAKASKGVSYLGGKIKDGAHVVGGKIVSGAQAFGGKVKAGAQAFGGKVKEGAQWVKQHGGAIKRVAKTAAIVGMAGLAIANPMAALTVGAGFVAAKAVKNVAVGVYGKVLKPIGQGAKNVVEKAKAGVSYVVSGVSSGVGKAKQFAQQHQLGTKAGKFARGALAAGLIGVGLTSPLGLLGVAAGVTVARGVRRTGKDIAGLAQKAYGGVMSRVNKGKAGESVADKIEANGSYVTPSGEKANAKASSEAGTIHAETLKTANEAATKVAEKAEQGQSYVKQAEEASDRADNVVEEVASNAPFVPAKGAGKKAAAKLFNGEMNAAGKTEGFVPEATEGESSGSTTAKAARKRAKGEQAYLSFDANVPSEKTAKERYNLDKINDPAVVADKDAALANIVRNQSDTEVGLAVSLRSIARYGGRGTQNRSIGAQIYAGINGGETQEGLLTSGMKEQLIVSTFNKPKAELYGAMSNEDRQKVLDSYQVVGGLRSGGGLHGGFGFEVRGKDGRQFTNNDVTADVLGQMMTSSKITNENINKSANELGLSKNLEAQLAKNLALGVDYSSDLSKTENMTDSKVYRTATNSKKHSDVVAQGILDHVTADPESDLFKNVSKDLGISEPKDLDNPATKERVIDQISRMKNSEGKNSINTIPESDYSSNLASVMKDKARSGEFNVTAWDYASAETKANEVANVEAIKDGTIREDLAAAEKRLSRQAVKDDEQKVLLNTFATAKVDDKSTIVNGMISSGKFVNTSAEDGKRLQGVVAGIAEDDTSENAQLVKSAGDDQLMLAMKKGVMLSDIGSDRAGLNVDVLAKYLKGSEDIDTALVQNIARRGMNNGSVKSAVGVLESSLTSDQRSSMLDSAANQGTLGLTVGENRNLKRMLKDTDVDVNKLSYFEAKSVLAGASTDQIAVEVEHEAKVDKATNKLVETQGNLITNDAVKAELEKGGDNQATASMFASNYADKMSMLSGSEKDGIKLNAAKVEIEKFNAENVDGKVSLAENASLADVAKAVKGNAGLSAKIDVAGLDAVDAENKQRLALGMGERLKMYAADVQGDQSLYNKARSAFRTSNPGKDLDEADSMVRTNYLANEFVNSLPENDKNMVNARRGDIDLDYISKMTGMSRDDAKALQKEANESGKSIDAMMIEKGNVKPVDADKVDTEIIKKMETGEFVELHNEAKRENYNEEVHGVNKVKYNILRNSPDATPAVDVDAMDYEQKSRYQFTRNLLQQMNRTGENPNMLANTFRNTNLYDNDRVVEEMAAIKIDGQDAINPKLSVEEKKKRLSNEQINAYLGSHEEYKEILTSYAAADVTRTLDDNTKAQNLEKIARYNPELSKKVNDEIRAQGKQPYQTSSEDYNKILNQLMQKDEAFKNAMYSKLTDAFDPGAKLSHAERIMFFENNKTLEKEPMGNTMKSINEWLSNYVASDGKDTGNILLNKKQNLPENSAVYDNWNKFIDSKIGDIQSKKGQYADMTGDQRKEEISKLQSKYIKPVDVDGLSDEELENQVKQQQKNKQDAFAVGDFTQLYSKGARVNKIESKNVRAVIAKNGFDSNGEFDVLTGKRITTDVEEKHKAELAAAINNETRYKAASKMRTSSDFGENFNAMAVSYLGKQSAQEVNAEATRRFVIANKGKATKTGILDENFKYEDLTPAQQKDLQTERKHILERTLGNNVAHASIKVNYDREMKEYSSWMQNKGLIAEPVRYVNATPKFTKQQSKASESGVVAPKTAAKIRANQNEYLSTKTDREGVEEFNRTYRGTKTQYANEVRQRVSGDSTKKAIDQLFASKDISGKKFTDNALSVQKAEVEKMLANLSNKAENRLNTSYKYIPSTARPYVGSSLSLAVNGKERELQISKLSDYRSALDSISKNRGKVSYDSVFNNMNSSVQNAFKNSMSSKARSEFNGKSDEAKFAQLEQYLLKNYNKLSNHVKVNNFYHTNTSALTNMNGVSVKRSVTSAEAKDIMKSLKPGEATRYNDIIHRRETEVVKYNKEEQHYNTLTQKLTTTKDVKEQKVIRKQMSDSATKLTTYQKTIQEIEKEKRVFEQKVESRRSAGDVRVAGGLGYNKNRNILDDYAFRTKGANGAPGKPVQKGGPLDRPMNMAILRFMERYKNQMQQIVKTEIYNQNAVLKQYTRGKVNKLTNDLSRTIADNRQLRKFMTSELKRLEGSMDEKDNAIKNALSNDIDRLAIAEQALKSDLQGLGIELSSMEKLVDNANKNAAKPTGKK